jgi:PIN domain nuclease of toxin-antitoxin system
VLLDTNVLVIAHRKFSELGKNTLREMERDRPIFFSPISLFELAQKDPTGNFSRVSLSASERAGFRELSLTSHHAQQALRFGNLRGSDPFDWLLLAQAAGAKQDFYTFDARLLALGLDFVVDASR